MFDFDKPLQWLRKGWWGVIVAYLIVTVTVYLLIWQLVEPLGIYDKIEKLPSFVDSRIFVHLILTFLIAPHITIALDLLFIRRKNLIILQELKFQHEELKSQYEELKSLLEKPLIIHSARWDAKGPEPKDVTQKAQSLVTAEGTLKIEASRYVQLFGETASGVKEKKCHVSYYLRHEATTDENEDLILPPDEDPDVVPMAITQNLSRDDGSITFDFRNEGKKPARNIRITLIYEDREWSAEKGSLMPDEKVPIRLTGGRRGDNVYSGQAMILQCEFSDLSGKPYSKNWKCEKWGGEWVSVH